MSHVLSSARYLWQMGSAAEAGGGPRLIARGKVSLGVSLEGPEREESLRRGGDGRAARLEGGYLALEGDAAIPMGEKAFTVAIRMRDAGGKWDYPILGSYGSDAEVSFHLRAVDGRTMPMTDRNLFGWRPTIYAWMFKPDLPRSIVGNQSMLQAIWGAGEVNAPRLEIQKRFPETGYPLLEDIENAVLKVDFPVQPLGPREWHDIVVCMTGAKLLLYVDGVLVDEEYPIGLTRASKWPFLIGAAARGGTVKAGMRALVDHVAVWDRALSEAEVVHVSGGAKSAAARELEILGPEAASMQYFRPRGHNRKAGDLIPFWHDGTLHMFYLILRRNMHSKWDGGHGGLEIWQATTTDLKRWTHHPVTVPITEPWEAWNGTGGVAVHDGVYYWYYPCPCYDPQWPHHGIQLATSTDGIRFTKQPPHPFLPGGDCEVYTHEDGTFHLIRLGRRDEKAVTLERLTSTDLKTWTAVPEPFLTTTPNIFVEMCPNLFRFGDWYYFMGGMAWWRSRQPFGPWEEHTPRALDNLAVPKVAAFGADRRIYAGFLDDGGWGGNSVLRELVQDAQGILGTKFVPELIPATGADRPVEFVDLPAGARGGGRHLSLQASTGRSEAWAPGMTGDVRITMKIAPAPGAGVVGLTLKAGGGRDGCDLTFDPANRTVRLAKVWNSAGDVWDGPMIYEVPGLSGEFAVDILCRHDVIDVEVGGFRSLVTRFWNPAADRIALFTEGPGVEFREVRVRPLA